MLHCVREEGLSFEYLSGEQLLAFLADYLGLKLAVASALERERDERGQRVMFCSVCGVVELIGDNQALPSDWELVDPLSDKEQYRHICAQVQ